MLLFLNEAFLNDESQVLLNLIVFEDFLAFQSVSFSLVHDPGMLGGLGDLNLLRLLPLRLANLILPLLELDSLLLKTFLDVFQPLLLLLLLLLFVEEHPFFHQFHASLDVLRVVDVLRESLEHVLVLLVLLSGDDFSVLGPEVLPARPLLLSLVLQIACRIVKLVITGAQCHFDSLVFEEPLAIPVSCSC